MKRVNETFNDDDNRDAQQNHRQYRRSHPYASASAGKPSSSSAQTGVTGQVSSVQTLRIEKRGHCFVSKLKFPVNNNRTTSTPSPPPPSLPSSSSPPQTPLQTTSPKLPSLSLSPTPQSLNIQVLLHDSGTTQQQQHATTLRRSNSPSTSTRGCRSSPAFHVMNDDDRAVNRQLIEPRSHLKNWSEKSAVIEMSSSPSSPQCDIDTKNVLRPSITPQKGANTVSAALSLLEEEEKGKDQERVDKQQEEQPQRGETVSVDYTQCDWLLRAFQENSNIP